MCSTYILKSRTLPVHRGTFKFVCSRDLYVTYGYLAHGINLPNHLSAISWDKYFVTMSGASTDEATIEIERKFTQIRWIMFGERVQKIFLFTPDWDIPFVQNPPSIIFNKTYPIRCEYCSHFIRINIHAWICITSNCRFRW